MLLLLHAVHKCCQSAEQQQVQPGDVLSKKAVWMTIMLPHDWLYVRLWKKMCAADHLLCCSSSAELGVEVASNCLEHLLMVNVLAFGQKVLRNSNWSQKLVHDPPSLKIEQCLPSLGELVLLL